MLRRHDKRFRVLTSALALAALLAQLAGYAHLAFTSHVTCAEHGELDEVGNAPSLHATAPRATEPRLDAAAETTHGHEHCLIASHRRDRATDAPARTQTRVVAETLAPARVVTQAPPPAIAILLLAPKSSPPTA